MKARLALATSALAMTTALGAGQVVSSGASHKPGTEVPGGTIEADTVWDRAGSPYLVSGTVEIGPDATLTLKPGVRVKVVGDDVAYLFDTLGSLVAEGRFNGRPVRIDGGGVATIVRTSSGPTSNHVSVRYAIIRHGRAVVESETDTPFDLRDARIRDFTETSTSSYPFPDDSFVVGNKFVRAAGWRTYQLHEGTNFFNNLFVGASSSGGAWITVGGGSATIERNTFTAGVLAVSNAEFSDGGSVSARENYWGTVDTDVIDDMILDQDDGYGFGLIEFEPILHKPDPGTPG